jgi:two-component sensor histidine kinase
MEHHIVDYGEYMPHGMCLLWKPWLVLLWAGSDLLIFLSYTAIPVALFMVLRKRTEVPQAGLLVLFASFIMLCGITHFFMIVTLWIPIYPFVGWVKLATGVISMATAVILFRLVPAIVRLPSPAALETANAGLQREIAAHQMTLASLERQVQARTAELESATRALAVQAREAVHRSSNLLAVVHTLAQQTAKGAQGLEAFLGLFLGRVQALANATRSIAKDDQASAPLARVAEDVLAVLRATYGDRISIAGPAVAIGPAVAQQLSLALHELGTNTHKYGLGASDEVRVRVQWTIDHADFTLCWCEQDNPRSGPSHRDDTGFGTRLLTCIIPATLGGTAERSFEGGGLIYRLTVPLASITGRHALHTDTALAARIIDTNYAQAGGAAPDNAPHDGEA